MAIDVADGESALQALQTQHQHRHFTLKVARGRTTTAGSVVLSLQVSAEPSCSSLQPCVPQPATPCDAGPRRPTHVTS